MFMFIVAQEVKHGNYNLYILATEAMKMATQNDLVFFKSKQALTTSLKVAEVFEKQHKDVLEAVRDILAAENSATKFFHESTFANRGKKYPMYIMNRDGFSLLAMGFTGKKALQFKLKFIEAFNAMEQKLLQQQNEQWQAVRSGTKGGYKELSAAVKELCDWAASQGCDVPEKYFYANFAKLLNKTLGIQAGKRDELELWQLYEIDKLQYIAKTIIKGSVAKGGSDYRLPYHDCKSAFDSYSRLSFINQRLLEAQYE